MKPIRLHHPSAATETAVVLKPQFHWPSLTGRDKESPQCVHQPPEEVTFPFLEIDLDAVNQKFADTSAEYIVQWASRTFEDGLVLSTSFGIHSAVMLHLVTQIIPNIPVIWIDTGYLPPETYQYAEQLTQLLQLNLKVYQSAISPARMEALYGRLWDRKDVQSLNHYNYMRKVEPMRRSFIELKTTAWLAGLRANQTRHRKTLRRLDRQWDLFKILPILQWSSKQVYDYLGAHELPYHPLFDRGYVTVGDWHSSRPLTLTDSDERDTRFQGLKQECGLHLPLTPDAAQSLDDSGL